MEVSDDSNCCGDYCIFVEELLWLQGKQSPVVLLISINIDYYMKGGKKADDRDCFMCTVMISIAVAGVR